MSFPCLPTDRHTETDRTCPFLTFPPPSLDPSLSPLFLLPLPQSQDLPSVVGLCRAEDRIIWLSALFIYKGILLIVGMFLAFETRNVKIRHLNDSKLIGMSVYGIVVLSVALAAVGILLEQYVNTFYAVVGLMVMLGNTSLLGLIFIPKVWWVRSVGGCGLESVQRIGPYFGAPFEWEFHYTSSNTTHYPYSGPPYQRNLSILDTCSSICTLYLPCLCNQGWIQS